MFNSDATTPASHAPSECEYVRQRRCNVYRSPRLLTPVYRQRPPAKALPLIVAFLCLPLHSQTDSAEANIRTARQTSNQAIRDHDLTSFAATLDNDFTAIRGNGALVPSRQAYIDLFKQAFADAQAVRYDRLTDKIEVSEAAPLAAEHGHWVGTGPNGSQAFGGTYLAMWRKSKAGWKLRSELFVVLSCGNGPACAAYRKPSPNALTNRHKP